MAAEELMLAVARIGALNGGVLLHRFAFATLFDGLTRIALRCDKG